MKICQVCAVDFTLLHFLLPLMREIRRSGHEVIGVCAEGPLVAQVRAQDFRVETVPLARSINPFRHVPAYRQMCELFRREQFDLVHLHTPAASMVGRLAAARAGVPRIVYTAHGFYFHDRMPLPGRLLHIALEWLFGRLTHTLLTQSAEDAESARRFRLCRGGDVRAIGNGSDPAIYHPDDANGSVRWRVRQALGTAPDRVVIIMLGRLVAEKGYHELFTAMREVDAELWVVGERLPSDHAANIDRELRRLDRDATLRSRIRLLGYRGDVPDLLRAADVFTLPSHREGMPRSIIEAMLSGLPVVATDIRGSREEVVDGECGLLVPVGDAPALAACLSRLATDEALRARFGAAALARARDLFDESRIIARQLAHLGL